jgi:HKD family nuclease
MYIIRESFIAKPGMASKLAKLMKEALASHQRRMKIRILTDAVADFNCVVMESEVASLEEFQKSMAEYANDKDMHAKMKGYTDMYISGKREIYQVM